MAAIAGPWRGSEPEFFPDRKPPHNIEAEQGTLGGLLLEPSFLPAVMETLRGPEDFYRDTHQILYKGILDLHESGQAIDGVTLAEWLQRKGYWNEVGEEEAISDVVERTANSANTIYYAQIVRQKAITREVIESANDILGDAYSNNYTSDQLVGELRLRADRLETVTTGWPEPNLDGMPAAVPFPLDALPSRLKDFVLSAAASFPCPPDFVALPCLAAAAAAIGRSVALKIKESWIESPALYIAFISPPGSTKSAALEIAIRPLMEIQRDELEQHQVAVALAKMAKRAEDADRKRAGKNAAPETDLELPKLKRTVVGDTTVEKLAVVLSENPRGVMMIHDELTAWLDGMGQYKQGGGNDRQFFLSAWSGSTVSIDRKNQENGVPLFVPRPCLSIAGPMTPDMLVPCLQNGGREDGFLDRMLIGFPDPIGVRFTNETIPDELTKVWGDAIKTLWNREMIANLDDDRDRPYLVRFTDWGQEAFKNWFDAHCEEAEHDDFPRHLRGPWAKLRGYCARLALVIECLDAAFGEDPRGVPRNVSVESLNRAIAIIEYFKTHTRRVHFLIQGGNVDNADGRVILSWAAKRSSPRFTEREVRDCFRRRFAAKPEKLTEALVWLTDRSCIRKLATTPSRTGRKPSDSFEIHPQILESARKTRKTPGSLT